MRNRVKELPLTAQRGSPPRRLKQTAPTAYQSLAGPSPGMPNSCSGQGPKENLPNRRSRSEMVSVRLFFTAAVHSRVSSAGKLGKRTACTRLHLGFEENELDEIISVWSRPRKGRGASSRSPWGFGPGMGRPGGSMILKRLSGQHTSWIRERAAQGEPFLPGCLAAAKSLCRFQR